jgi:hypothetical protein
MQRFLHEQPGAHKSYDIITQTCLLFEVIVRHIRPAVLPVAVKGSFTLGCSVLAWSCVALHLFWDPCPP